MVAEQPLARQGERQVVCIQSHRPASCAITRTFGIFCLPGCLLAAHSKSFGKVIFGLGDGGVRRWDRFALSIGKRLDLFNESSQE